MHWIGLSQEAFFFPQARVTHQFRSNSVELHRAKSRPIATELSAVNSSLSSRKIHNHTGGHNFHSEPVLWKTDVLDKLGGEGEEGRCFCF